MQDDEEFSRTKFVLAFFLPEQLSKSRLHFAGVVVVALLLNRVLILPRVGRSGIGMGRALPYCAYFDSIKLAGVVRWVTYEFHLEASLRVGKKPKVRYLCFSDENNNCTRFGVMGSAVIPLLTISHGSFWNTENQYRVLRTCTKNLKMKCLAMNDQQRGADKDKYFSFLSDDDLVVVNVITAGVAMRSLHHVTFVKALSSIVYAPQLEAKAEALANSLGAKFGAAHLRFEWMCLEKDKSETDEHRVKGCGEEGRQHLRRMVEKLGLSRIYVATDFSPSTLLPYESWSGDANCTKIVKSIVEDLQSTLNITTWRDLEPSVVDVDHGIKGIVDKLVCEKASVFVAGPKQCGGKHSFDEEAVAGRLSRGSDMIVSRRLHMHK